jgi:hypothetical protein
MLGSMFIVRECGNFENYGRMELQLYERENSYELVKKFRRE